MRTHARKVRSLLEVGSDRLQLGGVVHGLQKLDCARHMRLVELAVLVEGSAGDGVLAG